MSHLCHSQDPEPVNAGLCGCGATQGLRRWIETFDRANPLSLNVYYAVLVNHSGRGAHQSREPDLVLIRPRRRHLGWGGRCGCEGRRLGVTFTLGVTRTDREAVFAVGQIRHRAGEGC